MVKNASENFFEILAFDLATFWPLAFAAQAKFCQCKWRSIRKLDTLATSTGYAGRRPLPWLACNVARAIGIYLGILSLEVRYAQMETTNQMGLRSSFGRVFFSLLVQFRPIIVWNFCTKKVYKTLFLQISAKLCKNCAQFSFQGLEIGRQFIEKSYNNGIFTLFESRPQNLAVLTCTFHAECIIILLRIILLHFLTNYK